MRNILLLVTSLFILNQGITQEYRGQLEDAMGYNGELLAKPVTHNQDWTPVEQDFNGTSMVLVPAGSFEMGSNDDVDSQRPRSRQVFEQPFWLDYD